MPEVADSAAASRTSRKEKFRQYFRAFNPTASPVQALRDGLILDTLRSDRFHKIIAARIEVEPCSLQALAGGAGSGKTTELLLVEQHLKSLGHLPIYIEVSLLADLSRAEPGFLSAIVSGQIRSATGSDATLRPTHPIALLIDGLDRTPDMAEFQRLALPDLLFFRTHAIPTVCVAPLALQFMPQPELREQFDRIHELNSLRTSAQSLRSVLALRDTHGLQTPAASSEIAHGSGGLIRDLITLARDAGEAAYVDGSGRIEVKHATAAIQQLGLSYARGLSTKQRQMLEAVAHGGGFDPADPEMMFLLASRRVVEYSSTSFAVHPALVTALELDAF